AAVGRNHVRARRRQCRAVGERRGRKLPEQGASRHAGERLSRFQGDGRGRRLRRPRRMSRKVGTGFPNRTCANSRSLSQNQSSIMGFKCGILGLSNVGKSTVFNALTATAAAQASNYPFSTIEPNVGEVMVPDPRLDVLAKLAKSA